MSTPWGQKYSYFSGTIGGTDISANLIGLDVDAGGPGAIGTGTLHLVDPGAALTSSLVPMMEVKVWLPYQFTSAGVGQGVAARGRLLGGFLAARDSWSVSDKQYWDLPVQGYDILLKKLVRDTNQNRQIVLTAGHFNAQVTALVQAVQRNLQANVHVAIDTTVAVADLYATMPAVTLPGGHTLGWYLDYLCNTARSLSSALRPAYFMGYQETSGALDTFGNATLHVYDAALLPTVLYTFADDTSGGEKPILGKFKRHLETTAIAGRGQMIAANGKVATYAETASVPTYECQYINHSVGTGGNSGYWMDEPVDGGTDYPTEVEALPAITKIVQSRAYPRETITFQTHEKVLPGDTIGITWAAQGLSNTKYRVASARITPDGVGKLLYDLTVGKRKLELGEEATDIDGPPVIVDRVPLYPPTALSDPPTQAWGQYDGVVDVTFTWTAADDMRVTGYEAFWTNGDTHGHTVIGGRETNKAVIHLKPGLASTFWMISTAPGYKGSETTAIVDFTTLSLGKVTDTTYFALQTDADPFVLYDDTGEERGRIRAAASTKTVYLYATHPSTDINNIKIVTNSGPSIEMYDSATVASQGIDYYGGDTTTANRSYHRFRKGSVVTQDEALATNATGGFLYIPTCAGAPSGTPTSYTGTVALVYDTTGNALYVYNAGWKKVVMQAGGA